MRHWLKTVPTLVIIGTVLFFVLSIGGVLPPVGASLPSGAGEGCLAVSHGCAYTAHQTGSSRRAQRSSDGRSGRGAIAGHRIDRRSVGADGARLHARCSFLGLGARKPLPPFALAGAPLIACAIDTARPPNRASVEGRRDVWPLLALE